MKKFLLALFITSSLFLFSKDQIIYARLEQESCPCTRVATPGSYNITDKTFQYGCQPDPSYTCSESGSSCTCDDPDYCQGTQGSECSQRSCPSGTCVISAQKSCDDDLPGAWCINECRAPISGYSCPSGFVCCPISSAHADGECVPSNGKSCDTECVFGRDLPGFTCEVISNVRGVGDICRCTPPAITPGEEGEPTIPPINPWCDESKTGINTALGCISTDAAQLVQSFISLLIKLAGVVAFLIMVFAAIRIILAGGNPEQLQQGKEMLTAAIIGLILVIFSTIILELIGVHILQIPGFLQFQ